MTPDFVSAPPSNEFADATTRREPPHVLHQAADARSSGSPTVERTKQGLIAKVR